MAAQVNPSNLGISPPPPGVTANFVNPPVHLLGAVPILIIFNTFATICLALRLFTKVSILKAVGWEDAAITLAWGCNITTMVLYFVGIPLHNQAHIWNISLEAYTSYIKPALAVDLLLAPASGFPKIAILLFYLRINPFRSFQVGVWITIALVWGYIISIFCAVFFSCQPIHKLWDPNVREGHCVPTLPILLAAPAISTLLDLMILALPIPMLINLKANIRVKLLVAAIFSAFSITTIISAIRVGLLAKLLHVTDITWHAALVGDLTIVESNMMIVCGSLIVLRPFIYRYFPALLDSDRNKPSDDLVGPDGQVIVHGSPHYNDGAMDSEAKNKRQAIVNPAKKNKAKRGPSRNLWSISFGNSTKADEEVDVESVEPELKRLPPTAADMGDVNSAKNVDEKVERIDSAEKGGI